MVISASPFIHVIAAALLASASLLAQNTTGVLKGQVVDVSGAAIPGANVVVSDGKAFTGKFSTDETGAFRAAGLEPGIYSFAVARLGFANYALKAVAVTAGKIQTVAIPMQLQASKQEVTVTSDNVGALSTDPASNVSQMVLKGSDLDALPDDPDDLAADLQALAGPSAGPNGGQVYIDGFTGGSLPPKSSIREIRLNQNPFSAEYDRVGWGRIEILTKPGTEKFRGSAFFNDSDNAFNSRNPYLVNSQSAAGGGTNLEPLFQSRLYGGEVSGPVAAKRASFALSVQRREIDDNAIINATRLDDNLNPYLYSQAVATPNRNTEISPRIDYQIDTNNYLTIRYSFQEARQTGAGLGTFNLPSTGYNTTTAGHRVQITETAVLNAKTINETRFQFLNDRSTQDGTNGLPSIIVQQAFNGGGAQVGRSYDTQRNYEAQNFTSFAWKSHSFKAGFRVRRVSDDNESPANFGGTFSFAGGIAPVLNANNQPVGDPTLCGGNATVAGVCAQETSIERYRRTLLFQGLGYSPQLIRTLGGGASQFSIASGQPYLNVSQTDIGIYFVDDWRLRPNLTISTGIRYETQSNIGDHRDIAPRIGVAWAPGPVAKTGPAKTVFRFGSGIFYDRFAVGNVLAARRFNGRNELSVTESNPDFYPIIPAISSLTASGPQVRRIIDSKLRAPYAIHSLISVERQLPRNTAMYLTYMYTHQVHLFRTRNINAPLDGTYDPQNTNSGIKPYGAAGNIYQYESDGTLNEGQFVLGVNSRTTKQLSLFSFYAFGDAHGNTDGIGTFPADEYNLSGEYGRSSLDLHHRAFVGGSISAKYGLNFTPFIIATSGGPFNITTGTDNNGDLQFTDRPAFAPAEACGSGNPNIICTKFGNFNVKPGPGDKIIPRNYGQGPGSVTVTLRMLRTWGFGESKPVTGGAASKRYNVTLSVNARNLLNHVNEGPFSGNLLSPYFGKANSMGGANFGPPAGQTNNRRLEFMVRLAF